MGKGIEKAYLDAPDHARLIDNLKDQLLIVFLRRLGPNVSIPVEEIDDTGGYNLAFSVRDPSFYGATFCVGCRTHLPLAGFVWDGTKETVGS